MLRIRRENQNQMIRSKVMQEINRLFKKKNPIPILFSESKYKGFWLSLNPANT